MAFDNPDSCLKMGRRLSPSLTNILLLTAASCLSCAAVAMAQDLLIEDAPRMTRLTTREQSKSRLSQRNEAKQARVLAADQRQLKQEQDDSIGGHDDSSNPWEQSNSICKSVIAVGGWRLPDESNETDTTGKTFGNFDYEPMNTVLEYHENELDTEEEFLCETYEGMTLPIRGTNEQFVEMRRMLNSGQLVSAESSIEAVFVTNEADGQAADKGIAEITKSEEMVSLPPGSIRVINNDNDDSNKRRRLGNRYEGPKRALVVRVKDKKGRVVSEDASYLSDKFFGTYGDQVTMQSGFEACSFGKIQMTHDYNGKVKDKHMSAPGVVDVTLNIDLQYSSQAELRQAAVQAVQEKLGLNMPGPFHHVIFVVKRCYQVETTCQFAAYAYVNSWLSVFMGDNYKYPAVTMHELGHNLNLAHSGGNDGRTYTDHTCLMGNPLFSDNVGSMCFNPVKNFQIAVAGEGWYDTQYIKNFNSGVTGGTSWSGTLIGVADYNNNPSDHPIVLKLETGTSADWFIGFNRATGINRHNQEASDQVTIYKVKAGDGKGYSQSTLKETLRRGRSTTIPNWRDSGMNLVIKVTELKLWANPGYADVEILFGPQPVPTKGPTPAPETPKPTSNPTKSPTSNPTEIPTSRPTNMPTPSPSKNPTNPPSKSPTPPPTPLSTASPTNPPTNSPTLSGILVFDSGTTEGMSWSGTLIGVSHSDNNPSNNPSNHPIIIMLESGDLSHWFLGFDGIQVTITKVKDGIHSVKGALGAGQKEIISNWRFSGLDLVIEVPHVSSDSSPDYADILISLREPATLSPTKAPTPSPTTVKPTTSPSHLPTDSPTSPSTTSGISVFDSGTTGGTSWSGSLIGVADYGSNSSNFPMVLMLESGTAAAWFIGFNGVGVTITRAKNGNNRILGVLGKGMQASISNWRYSGLGLVIKFSEINTSASPNHAVIEVTFGAPQISAMITNDATGDDADLEFTFGQ